ncbi:MAG: antibiotic biosynthesis monooxygenase [Planctomycetes bacterium]|nr:antibiotic biosynthesis monooxygenase [Planctomycetota bacterium]
MITVGMNYKVIDGKGPEFEKVFNKVLEIMQAMAGHSESHLYKDTADSNAYLIVSEWSDQAAFEAFTDSDQFKSVVTWGKEKILSARPKHEIYGVGSLGGAGSAAGASCPAGAH